MTKLTEQIEAARAEVARLERIAATATCRELGCDMQSVGGCNCGCVYIVDGESCEGQCSVPVLSCTRCGDCDYGDNEEASTNRARCAERR